MTRVSDMPPEQQAAHYAKISQTLARVDETNADLAGRTERRRADGTEFDEWHQERLRQREREEKERVAAQQQQPVKPAPARPATIDAATAKALNLWADKKIKAALKKFDEGLVEATLEHLQERFTRSRQLTEDRVRGVEDRMIANESAVVDLLQQLEREIKELRERVVMKPIVPRLVGGSGNGPA